MCSSSFYSSSSSSIRHLRFGTNDSLSRVCCIMSRRQFASRPSVTQISAMNQAYKVHGRSHSDRHVHQKAVKITTNRASFCPGLLKLLLQPPHVGSFFVPVRPIRQNEYVRHFFFQSFYRSLRCSARVMKWEKTLRASYAYFRQLVRGVMIVDHVEGVDRLVDQEGPEDPVVRSLAERSATSVCSFLHGHTKRD